MSPHPVRLRANRSWRWWTKRTRMLYRRRSGHLGHGTIANRGMRISARKRPVLGGNPRMRRILRVAMAAKYGEHVFIGEPAVQIRSQGHRPKSITTAPDCWFGNGVTVMDGVSVGRGCVLAARAVVTRDLQDLAVPGCVTARVLRYRGECTAEAQE